MENIHRFQVTLENDYFFFIAVKGTAYRYEVLWVDRFCGSTYLGDCTNQLAPKDRKKIDEYALEYMNKLLVFPSEESMKSLGFDYDFSDSDE